MSEAAITQKKPYIAELKAGKDYHYCTCGHSKTQPWCDGTHKQHEGFHSHKFTVPETKKYALCGCRRSKNKPFCDATHKTLEE